MGNSPATSGQITTPSGGAGAPAAGAGPSAGNNKTAHIQAQIDETVGVMRDNIQKVNERGENLNDLQGKTGEFQRFRYLVKR